MMVNFSNHPYLNWSDQQKSAAEYCGKTVDLPFPAVDPNADETEIDRLARQCAARIREFSPQAVLCQGEFTLAYRVTQILVGEHIPVLAACTERRVQETVNRDGSVSRNSLYSFVRFRRYDTPGPEGTEQTEKDK